MDVAVNCVRSKDAQKQLARTSLSIFHRLSISYSISSSAKVVTEWYERECSACVESVVWSLRHSRPQSYAAFFKLRLL